MANIKLPSTIQDLFDKSTDNCEWPWSNHSNVLPDTDLVSKNGKIWPKISIITPSYNQGRFIEATIRSIILQGYPNLEYIIIDGGSTDDAVDVIKKYEKYITYWISEPDNGQSEAINKGLLRATGDIVAYLNSDDLYLPNTLYTVAEYFQTTNATWLIGRCQYIETDGELVRSWLPEAPGYDRAKWVYLPWVAPQASTFWTRKAIEKVGYFSKTMHYVFDSEYLLRLLFAGLQPALLDIELAVRTLHDQSKTVSKPENFQTESALFVRIFADCMTPFEHKQIAAWSQIVKYGNFRRQNKSVQAIFALTAGLQKYPRSTLKILKWMWGPRLLNTIKKMGNYKFHLI